MSDPVNNAQIEDVLSSIRRLVAGDREEDAGAAGGAEDLSEGGSEAKPDVQPDALVLTPSLRVEDAASDEITADLEAERWVADAETDSEPADSFGPADMSGLGGDSDAGGEEVDPDVPGTDEDFRRFSDDLPQFIRPYAVSEAGHSDPAANFVAPQNAEVSTDCIDDGESEGNDGDSEEETATSPNAPRAGFVFDSVQDVVHETEVDDADQEAPFAFIKEDPEIGETESGTADAEIAPGTAAVEFDALNSEPVDLVADDTSDAEAETAILTEGEPWAFHPEEDVESSGASLALSDGAAPTDETPDNLFAAGAGAIDEDALREIVTEMLQRELQGPLGERITRNVRKLVRREIHRALASRDFD